MCSHRSAGAKLKISFEELGGDSAKFCTSNSFLLYGIIESVDSISRDVIC